MEPKKPSFADLEQQMAKDILTKALKDLHGEIHGEIQRNKKDFSESINKSLEGLKTSLEQHVSNTIDQKMTLHLEKNFQDIHSQITSSYNQMCMPVVERTETNMKELREQGEATLVSWQEMMLNYKDLWTRPFFIVFAAAVMTGLVISLVSSYLLMRTQKETLQFYEKQLQSHQAMVLWYWQREKEDKKRENKSLNKNKKK